MTKILDLRAFSFSVWTCLCVVSRVRDGWIIYFLMVKFGLLCEGQYWMRANWSRLNEKSETWINYRLLKLDRILCKLVFMSWVCHSSNLLIRYNHSCKKKNTNIDLKLLNLVNTISRNQTLEIFNLKCQIPRIGNLEIFDLKC